MDMDTYTVVDKLVILALVGVCVLAMWFAIRITRDRTKDRRKPKKVWREFPEWSIGVMIRESRGSCTGLESLVQNILLHREAEVAPLIPANVLRLVKEGTTNLRYSEKPLHLIVFGWLRRSASARGEEFSLDYKVFLPDGFLFGGGIIQDWRPIEQKGEALVFDRMAVELVNRFETGQVKPPVPPVLSPWQREPSPEPYPIPS